MTEFQRAGCGRGGGYGLDAELVAKQNAKYDIALEEEAQKWIESVLHIDFPSSFADSLKDGIILCNLINAIKSETVPPPKKSGIAFVQMENISQFLKGCRKLGMPSHDCFETVDLHEQKDLGNVVTCIHALGRVAQTNVTSFQGPYFGVKGATSNKREFSVEQLTAGRQTISKISLGSSGHMERSSINVSNDIGFGTVAGKAIGGTTKISEGSSGFMERSSINVSNDIGFGTVAGKAIGGTTKISEGSSTTMERSQINVSNAIGFGTVAGKASISSSTKISEGSYGVMERSTINTSNDIAFGTVAGKSVATFVATKVNEGSRGVMERSSLDTSKDIGFGNIAGKSLVSPSSTKISSSSLLLQDKIDQDKIDQDKVNQDKIYPSTQVVSPIKNKSEELQNDQDIMQLYTVPERVLSSDSNQ